LEFILQRWWNLFEVVFLTGASAGKGRSSPRPSAGEEFFSHTFSQVRARRARQKGELMKRTILAGAALLAVAATPADAAFYSWQGDLFVTAVNNATACSAVGWSVGSFARGVFRPRNLDQNGPNDLLAWHSPRTAGQLAATGPLNGETVATIRIIYGSGGFAQFNNAPISGAMVSPAAPMITTPTVRITLTIPNAYSSPPPAAPSGCDLTLNGTLAKRLP
jgi:hypothetical protein